MMFYYYLTFLRILLVQKLLSCNAKSRYSLNCIIFFCAIQITGSHYLVSFKNPAFLIFFPNFNNILVLGKWIFINVIQNNLNLPKIKWSGSLDRLRNNVSYVAYGKVNLL